MRGKAITVITLAAFVLVSASCTMIRTADLTKADRPGERARILDLVMNSGVPIVFSGSGRIRGSMATGMAVVGVEERIPAPLSSIRKRHDGTVYEIVDRAGRIHPVLGVLNEGETEWTIFAPGSTVQSVSIPLSEVRQVRFRKNNTILTAIAVAVPVSLGLLYLAITAAFRE